MKNIVTRSISGIIYVALIICALLAGPDWFMALATLFALLAVLEFQKLTDRGSKPDTIALLIRTLDIAAATGLCLASYSDISFVFFDGLALGAYLLIRLVLALYDRRSDAFAAVGRSVMSVMYIGLPLSLAALADRVTHGNSLTDHLMLIMFIMIWLNDTGAYCIGSLLGHHRLFPRLSPKKSWEGFWGGMLFCVMAGVACYFALSPDGAMLSGQDSLAAWIGLGMTVCVFSTWGDLFESLIKRTLGVKDSGTLIPGHGGILDRIDSLLLAAPATFIYAFLTGML